MEHRPIDFNESKRRIFDDSAATQGGSEEWKPNAYQVRSRVKMRSLLEVLKFGFEYDDDKADTINIIENLILNFTQNFSKIFEFEINSKLDDGKLGLLLVKTFLTRFHLAFYLGKMNFKMICPRVKIYLDLWGSFSPLFLDLLYIWFLYLVVKLI